MTDWAKATAEEIEDHVEQSTRRMMQKLRSAVELAIAAERERCAQVCEQAARDYDEMRAIGCESAARELAAAIRRGP